MKECLEHSLSITLITHICNLYLNERAEEYDVFSMFYFYVLPSVHKADMVSQSSVAGEDLGTALGQIKALI